MPGVEALGETLLVSPLADAWVRLDAAGRLAGLRLARAGSAGSSCETVPASGALAAVRRSLDAFYEAPCDYDASPWLEESCVKRADAFSRSVWQAATKLPCGEVEESGAIAARLGRPEAGRAVTQAALACPLPGLIPIHRVGGAIDGAPPEQRALLRRLLEHEQEKLVRWWF